MSLENYWHDLRHNILLRSSYICARRNTHMIFFSTPLAFLVCFLSLFSLVLPSIHLPPFIVFFQIGFEKCNLVFGTHGATCLSLISRFSLSWSSARHFSHQCDTWPCIFLSSWHLLFLAWLDFYSFDLFFPTSYSFFKWHLLLAHVGFLHIWSLQIKSKFYEPDLFRS